MKTMEKLKLALLRFGWVFLMTLILGVIQTVNQEGNEPEIPHFSVDGILSRYNIPVFEKHD